MSVRALHCAVGVLGLVLLVACDSEETSKEDAPPSAPEHARVDVESMLLLPDEVRVRAGGTVSWTNMDSVSHRLVDGSPGDAEIGTLFDSDIILAPNGFVPFSQFEVTFPTPGEIPYFCPEHPEITVGRVIVQ